MSEHRLTWRMFHPVFVNAKSKKAAIKTAIEQCPLYLPAGTELYYGMVGGTPVYVVGHKVKGAT